MMTMWAVWGTIGRSFGTLSAARKRASQPVPGIECANRMWTDLGWENALVYAWRTLGMHHVLSNLAVPHRSNGSTPVVPGLTLPDIERGHLMHRDVFWLSHGRGKAPRSNVARNAPAQGQALVVIGVIELLVQLYRDGHPSD